MYYFDNKYLAQYLDQRVKLSVYVDYEWLDVADKTDVTDKLQGVGYDAYGDASEFDYRDIEQIRAGKTVVTLDMLQQQMGGQTQGNEPKSPDDSTTDSTASTAGGDDMADLGTDAEPTDSGTDKEKETDLSWYSPAYDVGRKLMSELKKIKNR